MSLNLNLGLLLITQNHVFPSSWPVWVESLYFDLHYKYMFYNNCYTCALYIVHHYDISYLTPFGFLFYKKDGLKHSFLPSFSPSSPIPIFIFSFGDRHLNRWAGSEVLQEEMSQPGWGKAKPCRGWHPQLCRRLVRSICLSDALAWGVHGSSSRWAHTQQGFALLLVRGIDPAPTTGNRGLPLTSAEAQQNLQGQTLDFVSF